MARILIVQTRHGTDGKLWLGLKLSQPGDVYGNDWIVEQNALG